MAGDWIKIEKSLHDKPEVEQISDMTGLDVWGVCGRLVAVWAWADSHTVNGDVQGVTAAKIDRIAEHNGFAMAMSSTMPVPWLLIDSHGLTFPSFDRHNGKSAKSRAVKNRRQARWRENVDGRVDGRVDA
jgi:hypothetical protein